MFTDTHGELTGADRRRAVEDRIAVSPVRSRLTVERKHGLVVPGHGRGVSPRLRTPYDAPVRHSRRTRRRTRELVWMTDRSRPGAALILAAGEGTRMRSATPKVLHPIAGRTLLGHAVHAAAGLRPEHLVVVIGHGARPGPHRAVTRGRRRARHARSPSRCRSSSSAPGTPSAAGSTCCPASSTGTVAGDLRRRAAARHARRCRAARRARVRGNAVTRAHRRARRPHRLRPHRARADGAVDRDRRAGGRHARSSAAITRDQLRRLRVRRRVPRRRRSAGCRTDNAQGELYLTDVSRSPAATAAGRAA